MQCGSDGQLYMEKEELELENKPEGVGKEKQAPEQKPAMTYAEFKAQKGRKRGKNEGRTVPPGKIFSWYQLHFLFVHSLMGSGFRGCVRRRGRSRWCRWRRPLLA